MQIVSFKSLEVKNKTENCFRAAVFPISSKVHTGFRVPTSAAFSETVVRRTGSQDEIWEHQCLCDRSFGELELISVIMFVFAWTISIYQTIKSVIFLLFLLGEMLAKECLNEISHKFLPCFLLDS